jgi:TolB protein
MIRLLLCTALSILAAHAQGVVVQGETGRAVPITLSGFTGEVAKVLEFDLYVAGFEIAPAGRGDFELSGKNNGQVEGLLSNKDKAPLFNRAYPGGSPRTQAHTLADDVIQAITGRKGVSKNKIAFKAELGGHSEIYVSDFDGANPVKLTEDRTIVAAPAWRPGHRMLFYTSYRGGNPDIYSHDLSSGTRSPVARFSGLNTSAALSPDGSRLALILSKSGSPDVWVGNADGSGLTQLTRTKEDESSPCWSPDGQTLCFASRDTGYPQLYTVSVSGGAMRRLSTTGVRNATEPDWSPDGKWIAFTRSRGGDSFDICLVPAAGGDARVLVEGEDPSWSGNSRTLIFTRRTGKYGPRRLSLLDWPTGHVKDVARLDGSCSQPSWNR